MDLTRNLSLQEPVLTGDDVTALQKRLIFLGYTTVSGADGVYGERTDKAVRAFQKANNLIEDGVVGQFTWKALFKSYLPPSFQLLTQLKADLIKPHGFRDSVVWQLADNGILIDHNMPETTGGEPLTIARIWESWGSAIERHAEDFGVPVELIMATICTETRGDPNAVRIEPGYVSDQETPHRVSPGLMQTLISTARLSLRDDSIDRDWLLVPENAIKAGTAYIARQRKATHFDPPKVACAYNAGGIYYNKGTNNRWKMRQYPLGSGEHADRYVKWFNDCFRYFASQDLTPGPSFYNLMGQSDLVIG
ncbi:MAG: peptidoglycan-binding protein [Gammaproteobacteria bacterium]|nr:peptidoglycan-binding protein [Gammaproteobacteria bacterium]